jgi:RND family efflux transporter MFP subunit
MVDMGHDREVADVVEPVGAETGGLTATAVYVDEGSYVRQGQALVQMNDALLRAQLRQQQAGVQTAEANAARDDAALGRAQELKTRGFLSQAGLDTALANQRASQANLASARAALSETQTRLSQATIKAPVSGLVISRSVTRGQIIGAGTELFRIVRDGRLELDAQVPETDLALVRAGQTATVSSDQVGDTTGRVRIVTPEVNPETRLGVARVAAAWRGRLPPRHVRPRPRSTWAPSPPMTVPTASVLYRENKAGVFVLRSANNQVRFQLGDRAAALATATSTAVGGHRPPGPGWWSPAPASSADGDRVTGSAGPRRLRRRPPPLPAAPAAR